MYRPDYEKGAFCSAIAGACASDPDLENAFFQNPAALTAGEADWNFDGDYAENNNIEPGMSPNNTVSQTQYMGGVGIGTETLGFGIAISGMSYKVGSNMTLFDDQGAGQKFPITTTATQIQINLPLSYRVTPHFSLGFALNGYSFSQSITTPSADRADVVSPDAWLRLGFTLGAIGTLSKEFRIGTWFRSPSTAYSTLDFHSVAFGNQIDFHEDMALHFPWIWALGGSYMPWEDERTLLFDFDFIGNTPGGFLLGYNSFSTATNDSGTVPKGHRVVIEPRLGYRTPWFSTKKVTLLFGTFYETSRYEGISGRAHVTGGLAYKVFDWAELMTGLDAARGYFQFFLTFR